MPHHLQDKGIYWSKIVIFSYALAFDAPVSGVAVGILHLSLVWKTTMVGLPDGEKNFQDSGMYNRLDTIPSCDRRTDRQTDILPSHSPRYA